jgi:hypothetical protein
MVKGLDQVGKITVVTASVVGHAIEYRVVKKGLNYGVTKSVLLLKIRI